MMMVHETQQSIDRQVMVIFHKAADFDAGTVVLKDFFHEHGLLFYQTPGNYWCLQTITRLNVSHHALFSDALRAAFKWVEECDQS